MAEKIVRLKESVRGNVEGNLKRVAGGLGRRK